MCAVLTLPPALVAAETLHCVPEAATGFASAGETWKPVEVPLEKGFSLARVKAMPCAGDNWNCRAENPNYHLTAPPMGSDFVGCWRGEAASFMTCEVFTTTIAVNFDSGAFAFFEDDGAITTGNGQVKLGVGHCKPAS